MKFFLLVTIEETSTVLQALVFTEVSGLPLCVSFVVSSLLSCNSLKRFYTQVLPVLEINTVNISI